MSCRKIKILHFAYWRHSTVKISCHPPHATFMYVYVMREGERNHYCYCYFMLHDDRYDLCVIMSKWINFINYDDRSIAVAAAFITDIVVTLWPNYFPCAQKKIQFYIHIETTVIPSHEKRSISTKFTDDKTRPSTINSSHLIQNKMKSLVQWTNDLNATQTLLNTANSNKHFKC